MAARRGPSYSRPALKKYGDLLIVSFDADYRKAERQIHRPSERKRHSPSRLEREVAEEQHAAVDRLLDELRLEVGHGGLGTVDSGLSED